MLTTCRLTNFVIVEITPIGIQNIGWKFWIVFTVFNTAFMPVIYFFYPETGKYQHRFYLQLARHPNAIAANRTLEDLDEYYRNNPPLIVTGDKDVTSSKRPLEYIEREETHRRRVARASGDVGNGGVVVDKSTHNMTSEHVE